VQSLVSSAVNACFFSAASEALANQLFAQPVAWLTLFEGDRRLAKPCGVLVNVFKRGRYNPIPAAAGEYPYVSKSKSKNGATGPPSMAKPMKRFPTLI